MNKRASFLLAFCVLALAVTIWVRWGSGGEAQVVRPAEHGEVMTRDSVSDKGDTRLVADGVSSPGLPRQEVSPNQFVLTGRVVPLGGGAVAGPGWSFQHGAAKGEFAVDASGHFELKLQVNSNSALQILHDRWIAIEAPEVSLSKSSCTVPVVQLVAVVGDVKDPSGHAVAGVTVSMGLPTNLPAGLSVEEWKALCGAARASSNSTGAFHLERVAKLPGARIQFRKKRYANNFASIPENEERLEIVLRPIRPRLSGVVLTVEGIPSSRATVRLGEQSAVSGRNGRFVLNVDPQLVLGLDLFALKAGHQPGAVEITQEVVESQFVEVILGQAPLQISGKVVDSSGEPSAGCHVLVRDATVVDPNRSPPETTEGLLGSTGTQVRTNRDGRFVLDGLKDRSYHLFCWGDDLSMAFAGPFAAGSDDILIRLPPDSARRTISGTLTSLGGEVLADQTVSVEVVWTQDSGRATLLHGFVAGPHVRTDEGGRFQIEGVPACDLRISCAGTLVFADFWNARSMPLKNTEDWQEIRWSVPASCRVRLTNSTFESGVVRVFNAEGETLTMIHKAEFGLAASKFIAMTGKQEFTFNVSEEAVSIGVYDGQEELYRSPLVLSIDDLIRIDL